MSTPTDEPISFDLSDPLERALAKILSICYQGGDPEFRYLAQEVEADMRARMAARAAPPADPAEHHAPRTRRKVVAFTDRPRKTRKAKR